MNIKNRTRTRKISTPIFRGNIRTIARALTRPLKFNRTKKR